MTHWKERATTRMLAELNGEWVNITRWVAMGDDGAPIEGGTGRQTELSQSEPSNLSFVLNDQDGRFTPDNTTGLYYPDWRVGAQIRWSETIGARTFHWPDMWVETLELVETFEVDTGPSTRAILDTFDRDETDQWGTADSGQVWATAGGVATDYNVGAGVGTIALTTTGSRNTVIGSALTDVNVAFTATTPQIATGDSYNISAIARWTDGSNFYIANAVMNTGGNVGVVIRKRVGGVTTNLITVSNVFAYAVGDLIGIRFQVIGTGLRCKIWNATGGVDEPDTWTTSTTDGDLSLGQVGVRAERNTSNTNTGLVIAVDDFTAPSAGPGRTDRHVQVTCVDLLTRLNRAPAFVSTFAAYVMAQHKTTMVGYWPLLDRAEPFSNTLGSPLATSILGAVSAPPSVSAAVIGYGQGATVPGDDLPALRLDPGIGAAGPVNDYTISVAYTGTGLSLAAGETVTVVAWVSLDMTLTDGAALLALSTGDGVINLTVQSVASGTVRISKPAGTLTGSLNATTYPRADIWYPVAIRFGFTPNTMEIWFEDRVYEATLSGTQSSPILLLTLTAAGGEFQGSLAHLQLYVGDSTDFSHEDFLAQFSVGRDGLANQSVDQRIRTIANYAGVPDSQLDLEESDTLMPAANFAAQVPGSLLTAAAETGGGVLFTHTAEIHYQDRKHRFDL